MKRLIAALTFLLLLCASAHPQVPATYFGMNFSQPTTVTWPTFPTGTCRIWDTNTNSTDVAAWTNNETSAGVYSWTNLDAVIATLQTHCQKLLFTNFYSYGTNWQNGGTYPSGQGPPSDLGSSTGTYCGIPVGSSSAYFAAYVCTLVTRYKGVINAYECWNEVNSTNFWTGTTAQMVTLCSTFYQIIHAVDPNAIVLSPSTVTGPTAVTWMNGYIAAGGGAYFDVYNIHCYPWNGSVPNEFIVNQIAYFNYALTANSLSVPTWCDEFDQGGVSVPPQFVAVQYLLGFPYGLSVLNWYQFDDASFGWMEGTNQGLNAGGIAYRVSQNWVSGGTWTSNPTRQANSNKLRNTTWAGVGTGTPGTAPTDMTLSGNGSNGITATITSVGSGFCWAVSGTPSASGNVNLAFESSAQVTASVGQVWTISTGLELTAGSITSTGLQAAFQFNEFDASGGNYLTTDGASPVLAPIGGVSAGTQIYSGSAALTNASVTSVEPQLIITYTSGDPVSFTLCFGGTPSMDNGSEWVGTLTRANGANSVIAWDAANGGNGALTYTTTSACGGSNCTYWRDISGQNHAVSGSSVPLTNSPIILDAAEQAVWFN